MTKIKIFLTNTGINKKFLVSFKNFLFIHDQNKNIPSLIQVFESEPHHLT